MQTEDGSIIHECLNGESDAFGVLVDKYKAGIYAFVYGKLGSFQDAQDVTQEVFEHAYRGLRNLRRWERFAFWLFRIAANRCKMWIRSQSRRPDSEFIEDQDPKILEIPSLDFYRESQMDESLQEALDSLPEIYREALMLHYFGGMTSMEIAKAIGASPTTIRMRLSRARAQLKEEMIAMMDTAFEGHRLQASFTFRVIEALKRIRINPMPRSAGLPWGLSLAAGIVIAIMTLGSHTGIHRQPVPLAFPDDAGVSRVREISVDILGTPGTSVIAGKQGDINGGGIDSRNPQESQNTFLLAPATGGGTWTQKADMPTARSYSGLAVVNGKIYVIGGWLPDDLEGTAAAEKYDPATDTWTKLADMPTPRNGAGIAAVDGIIYAIGGWSDRSFLSTVEAYDLATDTWTTKASMPTRRGTYAVTVDGRIYVFGGSTKYVGLSGEWGCVPTVEVYNPATDTWTQASDMPVIRYMHSASAVDGKIYIIAGQDEETMKLYQEGEITEDEMVELFSIVYVYDPATDTWMTAATSHPFITSAHAASVVDGKIYTIGGERSSATVFSTVYEYDPGLPDNISVTSPAGKLPTTWGKVRSD